MELTGILNLSLTYINSYALRCAVELDIAGHMQAYGRPMPLNELARAIPIPPEKDLMLGRLMGLLVHKGVFARNEAGYVLTPISKLGLTSEGSNLGALVRMLTGLETVKPIMCNMSEWFKNGGDGAIFTMANGTHWFPFLRENPEFGNLFNEAMTSHSKQFARDLVASYPHIFDGLNNLVDVGGGTGITAKTIANTFPFLRCTVFDLPHVVANASKNDSFDVVGGDMFEKIPPADAILLKNILHDWTDDDCIRILKRCKEAIEPKIDGSKVIVVDIIHGDNDLQSTETCFLFDILMMSNHGSKERCKQEWHDIILSAGYSGYKIHPALGVHSVMELFP